MVSPLDERHYFALIIEGELRWIAPFEQSKQCEIESVSIQRASCSFELFDRSSDGQGIGDQQFLFTETFVSLITLKLRHPSQFFLVRGNREFRRVNQMDDFSHECLVTFGHSAVCI